MNKVRVPTGCHKTFWSKWLFEHSTTHQPLVSGDKNVARSPKRFIQPNRYVQLPYYKNSVEYFR
jgi:hypothetical protein